MSMYCTLYAISAADADQVIDSPESVEDLVESLDGSDAMLSLERAWDGLHFALTGTVGKGTPPLNVLVLGGVPVGEDVGYGPDRLVHPPDVAALDAALTAFSDADFDRNFDLQQLAANAVYPGGWDDPHLDGIKVRAVYLSYLHQLKAHVRRAAEAGGAILITIS